MRHAMDHAIRHQKVNLLQLHALLFLREHDGATMTELARHLHVTSSTATVFIARLVRGEWVKRRDDRTNRKLVRLTLTSAGTAVIDSMMKDHQIMLRDIFSLLTASEQRLLLSLHQKLLSRLAEKAST